MLPHQVITPTLHHLHPDFAVAFYDYNNSLTTLHLRCRLPRYITAIPTWCGSQLDAYRAQLRSDDRRRDMELDTQLDAQRKAERAALKRFV